MGPILSHRLLNGIAALLVLTAACSAPSGAPLGSRTLRRMAEEVGTDVVRWLRRGYVPGRSGEILLVPKPWNVLVRRGSWVPGEPPPLDTSHSSPWAHHQRVPLVLWWEPFYATGRLAGGPSDDPVDPTFLTQVLAQHIGYSLEGQTELTLFDGLFRDPPRAVVVVVFDGGGWNLLGEYPDAWPFVRGLMERGRVYTNATVGSSPSVTAAVHATLGTGAYPAHHGIPDNTVRLRDGSAGDPWGGVDPGLLRRATLADGWDRANDNRVWVGLVGTEPWHVGMLGHGAAARGGDRDVAVLWNRGAGRWFSNTDLYALPTYLPGPEALEARLGDLDASDGARDGRWLDNDLADPAVIPGTPAFVEHQGEAILEVVAREPIGDDEITDLLFVELKSTDRGAHVWNLFGEEEPVVLRAQDDVVRDLVAALDEEVGRGEYLLALTADHGLTPLPERVGGLRIHPDAVAARIADRFGPIVEAVTPASVFLDMAEVTERHVALADVARFIGDLRYEDGVPPRVDLRDTPASVRWRRTFAAAFPGEWLGSLTDAEVEALGPGIYAEGDLTSPISIPALRR